MKYNIISDIAGRYNELLKLLDSMPNADAIILVGDLMDRGPDSKKVIEFAMKEEYNGIPVVTLKGNHELMMIESSYGVGGDHYRNGGDQTHKSYGIYYSTDYPKSHIEWMEKLPLFFHDKDSGLFVSHAPWIASLPETNVFAWEQDICWNRVPPKKIEGTFQVFGHNTVKTVYWDVGDFIDSWAICIDNSGHKVITGLHWPTKELFEVPYEL